MARLQSSRPKHRLENMLTCARPAGAAPSVGRLTPPRRGTVLIRCPGVPTPPGGASDGLPRRPGVGAASRRAAESPPATEGSSCCVVGFKADRSNKESRRAAFNKLCHDHGSWMISSASAGVQGYPSKTLLARFFIGVPTFPRFQNMTDRLPEK